jgi:ABC-2 type transport system permease protein
MNRILYLAQAEVLHVIRDRATLAQVFIAPLVQLLILANAATFQIRNSDTYIVDLDRTSVSRGLVTRMQASGHFRVEEVSSSFDRANEALLAGRVTLAVVIPHDFEQSLVRTGQAPIELSVNAEKGSAAGIVQAYALRIVNDYAAELSPPVSGEGGGRVPARIEVSVRNRYNVSQNYKHYMVPGILVALITLVGTLLTAQNIAREKELGTLEQLNVTPITRGQFIAGKLLPFWVLGMIELALGLALGRLAFDIPMRGSIVLLFGVAAVYLLVALGVGLWISTLVATQQQAMFVSFFIINIYLLMSGLFTPIDSMAPWVQVVTQVNPVRHFVAISRAILVKGAGLAEIARPLLILTATAAVVLTVAVRQHRKVTR